MACDFSTWAHVAELAIYVAGGVAVLYILARA